MNSTTEEIWNSLSKRLQRAVMLHVMYANDGVRGYTKGRWRIAEYGEEALERGVIEPGEHPKHFLTELGWKLGRYGLMMEERSQ